MLVNVKVSKRTSLKPGNYVIIPSTFDKDRNMKFVLRVYYETTGETKGDNISNAIQSDKNNTKPVVVPLVNPVNPAPNDYKQPVVAPVNAPIDLNDRYNKWFFDGLNQAQIANFIKEAQNATERLKKKM